MNIVGKYGNIKVMMDGITFHSKREAMRYVELKLLLKVGEISKLELQPEFELLAPFTDGEGWKHRGISYFGDFCYMDHKTERVIVEDVKGARTQIYLMKKKLFLAKYPHLIFREV